MESHMSEVIRKFQQAGLVPVVVLDTPEQAVPLAKALLDGGIDVMEVTYRTDAAEQAISRIAREVPEMTVGAGAKFLVSPGLSLEEVAYCHARSAPLFPGIATASELQAAVCAGLTAVKFFPAQQLGGPAMIQALGAAVPKVRFMPTGGIGLENLESYLSLPNVFACGGSWVCPTRLIRSGEFQAITALCRNARKEVERILSNCA